MKIKACLWTMFAVCVGSLCHVSAQPSVDDYLARTADSQKTPALELTFSVYFRIISQLYED